MKANRSALSLSTFLFSIALSINAVASDDLPEITEEGLHKLKDTNLGLVYAQPDADLNVYDRVKLLEPSVAFKKNWQRDQNRSYSFKVKASDMERMKKGVAELFMEVFTEELSEGGYELTEEVGEDVLLVRPAIVNLDITSPDLQSPNMSRTYSASAGSMTMYLELIDAETSDVLVRAYDSKADPDTMVNYANKITNRQAADRMLKDWSSRLRAAMDDVIGASSDGS